MVLCLFPGIALAAERIKVVVEKSRPLSFECIVEAATANKVPLAVLIGIIAVEGGTVGEAVSNTNGTWDLGPFQVNTCHVNDLLALGIQPEMLLRDGCINARAAAWLLRKEYDRTQNLWLAVGAYHSKTPKLRDAYMSKVRNSLAQLGRTGLVALLPKIERGRAKP